MTRSDWVAVTDRRRIAYERLVTTRMAKVYKWQFDQLAELGRMPTGDEFEGIQLGFRERAEKVLHQILQEIMKDTDSDFRKGWRVPETKSGLPDMDLWSWINELTLSTLSRLVESNRRKLRRLLMDGETDDDWMKVLRSSPFARPRRDARSVAVNTTTEAMNSAMAKTSERYAEGRKRVKTWKTTNRINVRPTHQHMQDVTIPADELFHVPREEGGEDLMKYPGDTSLGASIGNVINCHCMTFYSYVR